MKTRSGRVIQILFKDDKGICMCDDGWRRPISDLSEPTLQEVQDKRKAKETD